MLIEEGQRENAMGVADDSYVSYYQYDATGERTYKLTGKWQMQRINGQWYSYCVVNTPTLYASAYVVATRKGYTKHYYAESERIVSKIGEGGLAMLDTFPIRDFDTLFKQKHSKNYTQFKQTLECLEANAEVVSNVLSPLYEFREILSTEPNCYWYHPDHLGSGSWITFTDGKAVQHLHYLPWGEGMVDQRTTSFASRYTFSAKEKDTETGYSYFGSRYYSSNLSIWLSVDPMADKYPHQSNYVYCSNNPIRLVDPNGEDEWDLVRDGTLTKRENGRTDIDVVHAVTKDNKHISRSYYAGTINQNAKRKNGVLYGGTENERNFTTDYMTFAFS